MSQVLKLESNTHQTNINSNNNKIQPDKSNKSKNEMSDNYPELVSNIRGLSEETTTGVHRLYDLRNFS